MDLRERTMVSSLFSLSCRLRLAKRRQKTIVRYRCESFGRDDFTFFIIAGFGGFVYNSLVISFIRPLKLSIVLFGLTFMARGWWLSYSKLSDLNSKIRQGVERVLSVNINSALESYKKIAENYEIVDDDKEYVGLTTVLCDASRNFNKVIYLLEQTSYKKYLSFTKEDFPIDNYFLLEEGSFVVGEDSIEFLSNHGKTTEHYPLKVIKRGDSRFKALFYLGRPMHGTLCFPDQLSYMKLIRKELEGL